MKGGASVIVDGAAENYIVFDELYRLIVGPLVGRISGKSSLYFPRRTSWVIWPDRVAWQKYVWNVFYGKFLQRLQSTQLEVSTDKVALVHGFQKYNSRV